MRSQIQNQVDVRIKNAYLVLRSLQNLRVRREEYEHNGILVLLYSSTLSLKILESSQIPTEHFTILGQWECSIKDKEQDVGTRWYGHGRAKAAFKQEKENQRLLTERCSGISCQKNNNTFWPLRASIWVKNWQKGKNKDPNLWRERERRQPLKVSWQMRQTFLGESWLKEPRPTSWALTYAATKNSTWFNALLSLSWNSS